MRLHQGCGGFIEHRFSPSANDDVGAKAEVLGRDFTPETGAAAGDQDALALEYARLEHDARLNGEDDLADVLRGFHQRVCLGRIGEGEGLENLRLYCFGFE